MTTERVRTRCCADARRGCAIESVYELAHQINTAAVAGELRDEVLDGFRVEALDCVLAISRSACIRDVVA